jgi:hypothetical protein
MSYFISNLISWKILVSYNKTRRLVIYNKIIELLQNVYKLEKLRGKRKSQIRLCKKRKIQSMGRPKLTYGLLFTADSSISFQEEFRRANMNERWTPCCSI